VPLFRSAEIAEPTGTVVSGIGERPLVARLRPYVLPLAVAVAIFVLALKGGAYALGVRSPLAMIVWGAIAIGVAVSFWPRVRAPRAALVVGALLTAFALLQGLSGIWADSAENAVLELDRGLLYLGVFVLVVVAARQGSARSWSQGLAVGIVAVGLIALASRLFPDLFGPSDIEELNPGDPRLSYPVNYWNGLSGLVALGIPLLLQNALQARTARVAALAVAPLPALAATMYLTSSRGGAAAAVIGIAAFIVLTTRRVPALAAAAVGAVGSAIAIACVQAQTELVNGPLETDHVASQGRTAAVLIALACAATAAGYAFVRRFVPERVHLSTTVKRVAVGAALVVILGGVVAADPAKRLDDLKQPPETFDATYVQSHILSTGGNGRWQFWSAAVDQFESAPIIGDGAGSYAAWWLEHGSITYFTRNAHSLVIETMGELGAVGLLLLLALLGTGLFLAVRRVRGTPEADRPVVAALAAMLFAFAAGVSTDWLWDLTVVGVIGVVCLALLVGPATIYPERESPRRFSLAGARHRFGWRAAVVVVALAVIVIQASPLLTERRVRESQDALKAGDAAHALAAAREARDFSPWAASGYLQIALVQESEGDLAQARQSVDDALERDPSDWQLWAVASRIDEARGDLPAARESFDRAHALNPRSTVFTESQRP
jgi:O-antigen ligase/polysaccharide polymerase Wzy-like membrane protein